MIFKIYFKRIFKYTIVLKVTRIALKSPVDLHLKRFRSICNIFSLKAIELEILAISSGNCNIGTNKRDSFNYFTLYVSCTLDSVLLISVQGKWKELCVQSRNVEAVYVDRIGEVSRCFVTLYVRFSRGWKSLGLMKRVESTHKNATNTEILPFQVYQYLHVPLLISVFDLDVDIFARLNGGQREKTRLDRGIGKCSTMHDVLENDR